MKANNTILRKLTALTLTAGLVLTGCGSAKNDTAEQTTASTEKAETSAQTTTSVTETEETSASEKKELTTVRYAVMTGNPTQWVAIIGDEQGIWADHGIQIEISEFAAGIGTVDAVTTGQADIGFVTDFAGVNRIGASQGKSDLRFFTETSKSSSYNLYANPETVTSLEDLEGKNIITALGTFIEYLNGVTLEQAGLTEADVEYKPIESPTDVLALVETKQADAYWASGETARRLAEAGWEIIANQQDIGIETYSLAVSTQTYLDENADTVKEFLGAVNEINDFIADNTDEAAVIVSKSTGIGEEVFKNNLAAIDSKQEFTKDAYDTLQLINEWARSNGFYETEFDIKDFIHTDALAEVSPEDVNWQ